MNKLILSQAFVPPFALESCRLIHSRTWCLLYA